MMSCKKFKIFFPYNLLASLGMAAAKAEFPTMDTPFTITVSSFFVYAVLPPVDAAKSIIIEPLYMLSIISDVMRMGAVLPGIAAVVIMISLLATLSAILAFWRAINSADCSTA